MSLRPHIEIVTPVFNEGAGIREFYHAVKDAVRHDLSVRITFLAVNDGSSDDTLEHLQALASENDDFDYISLSRNYGHQAAVTCALDHADGDAVVLLDSDLQDDPLAIPAMINKWRQGNEVVVAERGQRGEGLLFRVCQKLFYRLYHQASGNADVNYGTYCLMNRKALKALRRYRERERYVPGLVALAGFRTGKVAVDRLARRHGSSKVGFRGLVRLALNAIFSFSTLPIRLFLWLGLVVITMSFLTGTVIVAIRVLDSIRGTHVAISGWASILAGVFFLGGIQLVGLRILGEYVGRIYSESKNRPIYNIDWDCSKHRSSRMGRKRRPR